MEVREVCKTVDLDQEFWKVRAMGSDSVEFYQYFISRFIASRQRDGEMFCDECGALLELIGRPFYHLVTNPPQLKISMMVHCDCWCDEGHGDVTDGGDGGYFSCQGITSFSLVKGGDREI